MSKRNGLSLVEVLISTLLVGVLLVSALKAVGAVLRHRDSLTDRSRALMLANGLLSEILEKGYADPTDADGFGCETDEDASDRQTFDDVDDYANWLRLPPENRLGVAVANSEAFQRSATVFYVDPSDISEQVETDLGIKRIRVAVEVNGVELAVVEALRTQAHDEMQQQ
ncbi:type IV pilus modification PilV family protein [Thalassoroseus pseudoceratinae]|uniref:type IV pilus modification PilV family protein n=1 Tax=Thalassoroseus pseudoceratinae TaxID=2713176 RepID=UPI0014244BA3|nr:prepilin-type N-terminal cleavage/methylation domain-containing protein [Thalassoroseus pseudoceratinae]